MGDEYYASLRDDLRDVNRDTEKWLKFVSEQKSKLKKSIQEFSTNFREEYDERSKDLLKPTPDDIEKRARNICTIMLGDLYTLTMYGSISEKDYFSGYERLLKNRVICVSQEMIRNYYVYFLMI